MENVILMKKDPHFDEICRKYSNVIKYDLFDPPAPL
jgi:hypothetical protein